MTPNIADIIRLHVALEVRCVDRRYLHAYMPKLQTSGGLCYFLHDHLGHPIPSPALFRPLHDRFVTAVDQFVTRQHIPRITFESGQNKDDLVNTYRARFTGRDGVVIVGVAQEKMRSFKAHKRCGPGKALTFDFSRQSVAVITSISTSRIATGGRRFSRSAPICPIRSSSVSTATSGSRSASVGIAFASRVSITAFCRVPIPRRSRRHATRSARRRFRRFSIGGHTGFPGR